MSSCCQIKPDGDHHGHDHGKPRADWLMRVSVTLILAGMAVHLLGIHLPYFDHFGHAVTELAAVMWWGIAAGIIAVGVMQRVPREYFNAMLGRGDTFGGLMRAAAAGVVLDLCSHGILMIAAKLYERGASIAQVMTFLIASPWNSFSLTLILIALVGLKWTVVFLLGSVVIAVVTGMIFIALVKRGVLPDNPNKVVDEAPFDIKGDFKARMKAFRFTPRFAREVVRDGFIEGKMVMRWLFFGMILAALVRAYVPTDMLAQYFGPTLLGLFLTLLATTLIEVCSEGSTPVGAELVTRANAPGNGFTFLMAGVSTDYTEMLVLREATKSWKIPLFLPLVTVPQVLALGYIMNMFGS